MNNFFQAILDFFTSEKVAYIATSIITFGAPIWAIVEKILNKKFKVKLTEKTEAIKNLEQQYKQYVASFEEIVKTLEAKYNESQQIIKEVNNILGNQSEALKVAFNNSNLNASAKKLIEEMLNYKVEEQPVEETTPAVNEETEQANEVVEENEEIVRAK